MEQVDYIDNKADSIKNFALLSNIMWRRATYLLASKTKGMEEVIVLDPCAGAGKLISDVDKAYKAIAYEPDYAMSVTAKDYLTQNIPNSSVYNSPFEIHFSSPFIPNIDLVISIPYADRNINSQYEKEEEYLKIKNYALYCIIRSLDIIEDGGFGVFAIPRRLMDKSAFKDEIEMISEKANILSVEGFEDLAIILLQKEKIK